MAEFLLEVMDWTPLLGLFTAILPALYRKNQPEIRHQKERQGPRGSVQNGHDQRGREAEDDNPQGSLSWWDNLEPAITVMFPDED